MYSDLILIWGSNPLYTQIPNAHYLTEARYKGAQIVTIAPDYSASSVHADLFVPVKPGCDAALALGIAHELIANDWIDRDFLVEQTDMPLLVRDDTRLFLRSSDLAKSGSDEELYFWDAEQGLTLGAEAQPGARGARAAARRPLRRDARERRDRRRPHRLLAAEGARGGDARRRPPRRSAARRRTRFASWRRGWGGRSPPPWSRRATWTSTTTAT